MKGGTTFHFVTDGIHAALQRAKEAAKDKDVRIGGGVATIQQYLRARLIDELHLAIRPILMGSGENLFAGMDMAQLGYLVRNTLPRSSRCMWSWHIDAICQHRSDSEFST
jgi:dihydrofolate reductase